MVDRPGEGRSGPFMSSLSDAAWIRVITSKKPQRSPPASRRSNLDAGFPAPFRRFGVLRGGCRTEARVSIPRRDGAFSSLGAPR